MQILFHGGFQEDEVDNFKGLIEKNITTGLKEFATWIIENQLDGYEQAFQNGLTFFIENTVTEFTPDITDMCKKSWSVVCDVYDQAIQYMNFPHLPYYMDRIDTIGEAGYVPNNEDIVRCRQATIGASTANFYHSKYWWQLVDVGGHSPERSKWISIVEQGVQGMIFFVALDDFDSESTEERGKTKFEISQLVWEEVINSTQFAGECTMLFLNKMDIFEKSILQDDLFEKFKQRFPTYEGDQNPETAIEFMRDLLLNVSRSKDPEEIYTYATCAIDSEQMSFIWGALKDHIFRIRMGGIGMGV